MDDINDVNVGNEANESDGNESKESKFKFPSHVLWSVFFEVNKKEKEMKCKLCNKIFKFPKSANTTNANSHLNIQNSAHRNLVLSKMVEMYNLTEWSDEK